MESYAQRIKSIDMRVLRDSDSNAAIVKMLSRLDLQGFQSTYISLATLLKRLRPVARQVAFATPPKQTTVPGDPNYSGGSTGSTSTNSSSESKAEPYVQNVALRFLEATHITVIDWMEGIKWVNPLAKVSLSSQYIHLCVVSDCSSRLKMEMRLGKAKKIKAIDDGGISMYFKSGSSAKEQSRYVVLSVEVGSILKSLTL